MLHLTTSLQASVLHMEFSEFIEELKKTISVHEASFFLASQSLGQALYICNRYAGSGLR
jgi:hypothetical protein